MAQVRTCSPTCASFKCSKNSIIYRRDGVWCRETEEACTVANCLYALCFKRRLLPGGICGETVKRKTVDRAPEEVVSESIRLRGKALRKIGDKEIF